VEACNLFDVTSLPDFFGDHSPLKAMLPGFQPRTGQAWMAEAVAEAIADSDKLVIEAGTGTGKTFAYLLPALMSGRKTIISTGTKALQDQLYHRDLPLVGKAVGRPASTASACTGSTTSTTSHRRSPPITPRCANGVITPTVATAPS
jgi:superfamily II DNA or RNA helicase